MTVLPFFLNIFDVSTFYVHTALPALVASQNARRLYLTSAVLCVKRSIPPFFPPSLLCEYRILALLVGLVEDSIEDFKFVTVRLREEKVDLWDVKFTSGGFLTQDIWLTRGTKLILKQKKTK
jgi:hypothetical protein